MEVFRPVKTRLHIFSKSGCSSMFQSLFCWRRFDRPTSDTRSEDIRTPSVSILVLMEVFRPGLMHGTYISAEMFQFVLMEVFRPVHRSQ